MCYLRSSLGFRNSINNFFLLYFVLMDVALVGFLFAFCFLACTRSSVQFVLILFFSFFLFFNLILLLL